jgi:hypothetical protein
MYTAIATCSAPVSPPRITPSKWPDVSSMSKGLVLDKAFFDLQRHDGYRSVLIRAEEGMLWAGLLLME